MARRSASCFGRGDGRGETFKRGVKNKDLKLGEQQRRGTAAYVLDQEQKRERVRRREYVCMNVCMFAVCAYVWQGEEEVLPSDAFRGEVQKLEKLASCRSWLRRMI